MICRHRIRHCEMKTIISKASKANQRSKRMWWNPNRTTIIRPKKRDGQSANDTSQAKKLTLELTVKKLWWSKRKTCPWMPGSRDIQKWLCKISCWKPTTNDFWKRNNTRRQLGKHIWQNSLKDTRGNLVLASKHLFQRYTLEWGQVSRRSWNSWSMLASIYPKASYRICWSKARKSSTQKVMRFMKVGSAVLYGSILMILRHGWMGKIKIVMWFAIYSIACTGHCHIKTA